MKILILGAGQVGSTLAKYLSEDDDNDITIIDKDEVNLLDLQRHLDIKTVCGFAAYPNILEEADIRNMDMVIAVTRSDEGNMLACQMAHTLYQVDKKIARVRTAEYLHRKELFSNELLLPKGWSQTILNVWSKSQVLSKYLNLKMAWYNWSKPKPMQVHRL